MPVYSWALSSHLLGRGGVALASWMSMLGKRLFFQNLTRIACEVGQKFEVQAFDPPCCTQLDNALLIWQSQLGSVYTAEFPKMAKPTGHQWTPARDL